MAIDLAEDRERFAGLLAEQGIRCPEWGIADDAAEAVAIAERIGYPVLVRPSYVLGGRAMRVCYRAEQVVEAFAAGPRGPTLVDRFLEGALEIDVDALCDGRETYVAAVMEHVEEAGVHSGDSSCALPAPSLDAGTRAAIEELVSRLAPALGVVGLVNVQLAIVDGEISVLEANPRASRTVPVREQGDGRQSRRGGLPPHGRCAPVRTGPVPGTVPATRLCQGCRVSVRAVPGIRPRARPGDALHGRGDGDRRGLRDRVRQG